MKRKGGQEGIGGGRTLGTLELAAGVRHEKWPSRTAGNGK